MTYSVEKRLQYLPEIAALLEPWGLRPEMVCDRGITRKGLDVFWFVGGKRIITDIYDWDGNRVDIPGLHAQWDYPEGFPVDEFLGIVEKMQIPIGKG